MFSELHYTFDCILCIVNDYTHFFSTSYWPTIPLAQHNIYLRDAERAVGTKNVWIPKFKKKMQEAFTKTFYSSAPPRTFEFNR